ncbi:uncharacterized protein LOC126901990 isoform X1 [Daktulosphaira vitifoliae]|uniref:uncharacterized protein LOC126901990 isoform X1 n=1 Tax=Daktulosphaira vitifoliae TaxID=58002 RepID=UPI0021AAABF8|nr:uncharacterized protein LOC126901990 isoform X1 [Daktulosphaira vitifoliae]
MNYYYIDIILLNIIISNAIIVQETNELYKNIENQTFITNDDLNQLIRKYPGFIKLYLQENKYYTGSDASLCPLPYDETTLLDDPDVKKLQYFDPRECEKPWTWTQQNQIIVPVPKDFTINKKLGELVRQDSDLEILQKYTYYLNTIESVGITLVDRFCLFLVEAIDRIDGFSDVTDVFKSIEIKIDHIKINFSIHNFKKLFKHIYMTFKKYFISTLILDCISNILQKITTNYSLQESFDLLIKEENKDQHRAQLLECRKLANLKRNYAILVNDNLWNDFTLRTIYNIDELIQLHYFNTKKGAELFNVLENLVTLNKIVLNKFF